LRRYLGGDEDMREILIRVDREALADVISRYIKEENIDKVAKVVGYIRDEGVKEAIVE
jgi:predicted CopG family antitoxin